MTVERGVRIVRSKELLLGQFLEGINQAIGGGRHMIHHHQDTRWFPIVALLETISKLTVEQAVDPLLTPPPVKSQYEADERRERLQV